MGLILIVDNLASIERRIKQSNGDKRMTNQEIEMEALKAELYAQIVTIEENKTDDPGVKIVFSSIAARMYQTAENMRVLKTRQVEQHLEKHHAL